MKAMRAKYKEVEARYGKDKGNKALQRESQKALLSFQEAKKRLDELNKAVETLTAKKIEKETYHADAKVLLETADQEASSLGTKVKYLQTLLGKDEEAKVPPMLRREVSSDDEAQQVLQMIDGISAIWL
jgi:paraquat-inducible protein B